MQNNPWRLDHHFKLSLCTAHNQDGREGVVEWGEKRKKVQLLLIFMQIHKHHMHLDAGEELARRSVCGARQNITPLWIWFVSLFHTRRGFERKVVFTHNKSIIKKKEKIPTPLQHGAQSGERIYIMRYANRDSLGGGKSVPFHCQHSILAPFVVRDNLDF